MATFDPIAGLPIEIEGYELEDRDRTYGDFTRPSTSSTCAAAARRVSARTSSTTCSTTSPTATPGPVTTSPATPTLGEFCEFVGELDLFVDSPPARDISRHYRRWAYESAALDLALRQGGVPAPRGARPRAAAADLRLLDPPLELRRGAALQHRGGAQAARQVPGPALQARPRERLGRRADRGAQGDRRGSTCSTSRASTRAPRSTSTPIPELYRKVAEAFPDAWLEDPDLNDETRAVLEPHADRLTWDAPLHSLGGHHVAGAKAEARSTRSRRGSDRCGSCSRSMTTAPRRASRSTAAARASRRPGRGQIQYLASLFHPDTSNDVAPVRLQRPLGPRRAADQPDGPGALADRLPLG